MGNQESLFKKPITEVIEKRISVRTYLEQPLTPDIKDRLQAAFSSITGPFRVPVRFVLMESDLVLKEANVRLGTYGVIKGASAYVAAAVKKADRNLEELGYTLEELILYAASLGLGTCWLGGTFKKSQFAQAVKLKNDEILPCVTPIGYPSSRKRILDSVMRFSAGSKNRKEWRELFFLHDFATPLTQEEAGKYAVPLEMLRLAPSASNKQPWRIVKDDHGYHFFLQHTKGYAEHLAYDLQRVDMGIAMCHFALTAKETGMGGRWEMNEPGMGNIPHNTEYLVSWRET
ncbi:nitroreductase [Candidatus Formimonas warabiya]|uniref:Nitroreductase n=2 Tax=Formimonas warabiya TaxID=1761012 RepID=A0A3G1KVS4_FORW1|nr:nitroreductase family protein [Candidatus Formimonas warabiya]ATW26546.1 nitroreductase [Candidatus Formimonas warabiya]